MIYMLSQSWAENNSRALAEKILPYLNVDLSEVVFVDTTYDAIDVNKFSSIICFDRSRSEERRVGERVSSPV